MERVYPVMLRLEGERCLVVGGGAVAERKVRGLLEAGAEVRVVSPSLTCGLEELASAGSIDVCRREYQERDLDGVKLVYAATGERDTNARVAADAKRLGVLAGIADRPEEGAFLTPAIVRRGKLVMAVTASGASPALASSIAAELAERYDESYEAFVDWLGRLREAAIAGIDDPRLRRGLLREALHVPEREWRLDTNNERMTARLTQLAERAAHRKAEDEA